MRVLIAVASKYGATAELGQLISSTLAEEALDVTFDRFEHDPSPDGYDALVLGSAVYAGHWLKPAREWVAAHRQALSDPPVWLFSSGPVGEPLMPKDDTLDVSEITDATSPREHRVFAGKLDRSQLKFADKAIAAALRVPDGDFRDFDDVRDWAAGIADALRQP